MALTFPDNMVRFIACTLEEYNGITTKDNDVFYRVTNGNNIELYLGSELLSNETELQNAIVRIAKNESDIATIKQQLDNLTNYDDSELRGLISSEAAAREAADNALGDRITTLDNNTYSKEEINTQVDELNNAINNKVSTDTYNTKVAALEEAIEAAAQAASTADGKAVAADGKAVAAQNTANEAKSAIDAFLKDADASTNAIDTLKEIQAQLDAGDASAASLEAAINQLRTDLTTETSERKTADGTLDGKIVTNAENISKNATAIADEKTARENAISNLTTAVNGKANQSDLSALSTTVSGHTASITTLQGDVAGNEEAIEAEVNRATAKENEISEALDAYKTTVSDTYETKTDATSKKTELESQITQAKTEVIGGTDEYANWNNTAYATTIVGAKKFARDVALNTSAGAVGVANQNTETVVQSLINTYLTWNSLSSLQ